MNLLNDIRENIIHLPKGLFSLENSDEIINRTKKILRIYWGKHYHD
ncbi:MAG: hypothetical protein HC932_03075 [Thermales bacterium]|nr:hypothetical protein [Thermales bacterium]